MTERIIRVFPRRTKATPTDGLAFVGWPPIWWPDKADEVHVSVSFTWDIERARELKLAWECQTGIPTRIGGPALGDRSDSFTPGLYLKPGYVKTSAGCPERCPFCYVWKREGDVHELPIVDGWNVIDDNLLACSEPHIRAVFDMLKRQNRRAEFTGGLAAARLKPWHVDLLADLNPKRMYFAYDSDDDLEPLIVAGQMLREAGFTVASHRLCCYVLIGFRNDTFEDAETRLNLAKAAGFFPFAMLYRDDKGARDRDWISFQRRWARPQIVGSKP